MPCLQSVGIYSCLPLCCPFTLSVDLCSFSQKRLVICSALYSRPIPIPAGDMATTSPSSVWPSELCGNFYRLRCDMTLCDTTVIGSDGETLRAHSAVLAASSDLLKTQLIACREDDAPFTVHVNGMSGHLWDLVLRFIYSGKTEPKNTLEARGILHAGETLGIEPLADVGLGFLEAGVGDSEFGEFGYHESDASEVQQLFSRRRSPSVSSRRGHATPSYVPWIIPSRTRGSRSPSPYLRSPGTSRRHSLRHSSSLRHSPSLRRTPSPSSTILSRRPMQAFSLSNPSNQSHVAVRGEDSPCSGQFLTAETDTWEYVTYATSPEGNIHATSTAGRASTCNASAATQTVPTECRPVNESGKRSELKGKKSGKLGKSRGKSQLKRSKPESVIKRKRVDSTKKVDRTLIRKALGILRKLNEGSTASEQPPARAEEEQTDKMHANVCRNTRNKPTYSGCGTWHPGATVDDRFEDDQNMEKHTSEEPWYCSCAPCIPGVPVVSDEQVFSRPGPLSARRHDGQDIERDCVPVAYDYQDDPCTSDASNNASDGAFTERRSRDRCSKCHRRDRSPPPKRLYACSSCGKGYPHLSQLQRHRMCRHSKI